MDYGVYAFGVEEAVEGRIGLGLWFHGLVGKAGVVEYTSLSEPLLPNTDNAQKVDLIY